MEKTLLWDLFLTAIQRLPAPLFAVVAILTALVIWTRTNVVERKVLTSPLAFLHRHGTAVIAVLAFALCLLGAGLSYAKQAGYIRCEVFEGRVVGDDVTNAWVVAVRDGQTIADATSHVNASGYFAVDGLFRARYTFTVVKISRSGDQIAESEFPRDLRSDEKRLLEYTFPDRVEQSIHLATLYFDTNKSTLTLESQAKLLAAVHSMPSNVDRLYLFGHADNRGSRDANFRLGSRRARAAFGTINPPNSPPPALTELMVSFGELWPVNTGTTPKDLADNRRVEIYAVLAQP